MSYAARARCRPVVQDVTARALFTLCLLANIFSNSATLGPWVIQPESIDSFTEYHSSSPRIGTAIGIFLLSLAICISQSISFKRPVLRSSLYSKPRSFLLFLGIQFYSEPFCVSPLQNKVYNLLLSLNFLILKLIRIILL